MAMSKEVSSYFEDMLECLYCKKVAVDPHLLKKCSHIYCKDCVQWLLQHQHTSIAGVVCVGCDTFSEHYDIGRNCIVGDIKYCYEKYGTTTPESYLPQIHQHKEIIDKKLEFIAKTKNEVRKKQRDVSKSYGLMAKKLDVKLEERISAIKQEHQRMKERLVEEEKTQMELIDQVQDQLSKKEGALLMYREWIDTSLEKTKSGSVLCDGGVLLESLEKLDKEKGIFQKLEVRQPGVEWSDLEWNKLLKEGRLGNMSLIPRTVLIYNGLVVECEHPSTGRFFREDFKQLFRKPPTQVLEIKLPGYCNKITITDGNVWAPITKDNIIQIYNYRGHLQKTIYIAGSPRCIEKSPTGEMVVCCSDTGLFILNEDNNQHTIIDNDKYSDMSIYGDRMYAWAYKKKQIVEFVRDSTGWTRQERVVTVGVVEQESKGDTLLVRANKRARTGVEFFIGLYRQHFIFRVTGEGQLIKKYGGIQVEEKDEGLKCESLKFPRACALNSDQILLADSQNNAYKVVNTDTSECTTVFTGDFEVVDVRVQDKTTVWLNRTKMNSWVINKMMC